MSRITAHRYHDISCGHRVVGHEGKCRNLHGHNYRIHFFCDAPALDTLGRVVDFGIIKQTMCAWVEDHWDHRMILWDQDPWVYPLVHLDTTVVTVPFNPTAENIGLHLLEVIGPRLLPPPVNLYRVTVEETRKCGATVDA